MKPDGPIVLVGFMGCGKSHVGRLLAQRRRVPFVDVDRTIVQRERKSIPEIFAEQGEPAFRRLEWITLQGCRGAGVVACGGGAFTFARVRQWCREFGISVWLDASLEETRRRLDGRGDRPLWPRAAEEQRRLYARRRAAYALADLRVGADDTSPERTVEHLETALADFR